MRSLRRLPLPACSIRSLTLAFLRAYSSAGVRGGSFFPAMQTVMYVPVPAGYLVAGTLRSVITLPIILTSMRA